MPAVLSRQRGSRAACEVAVLWMTGAQRCSLELKGCTKDLPVQVIFLYARQCRTGAICYEARDLRSESGTVVAYHCLVV